MNARSVPDSLRVPALKDVWLSARQRLDRFGPDRRGSLKLPELDESAALALQSLVGRSPKNAIDLAELETGLVQLGVGEHLDDALRILGHPPSPLAAEKRHRREVNRRIKEHVGDAVGSWTEPWAEIWLRSELSGGSFGDLSVSEAVDFMASVRAVLDAVVPAGDPPPIELVRDTAATASRTDLAARLFGSAHALDSGTRLERATARALNHALRLEGTERLGGEQEVEGDETPWERAGFHTDLVSFPVLTWGLDHLIDSPLARMAQTATEAGLPLPITRFALERHPVSSIGDRPVLAVENPRLVEAAAEIALPHAVITTNGNPRKAPLLLVSQLLASGTEILFHGDFDSAGLAICARMAELGCVPTAMSNTDYAKACDTAAALGIDLRLDDRPAASTPWDTDLRYGFNRSRRIVHEELFFVNELSQRFGA